MFLSMWLHILHVAGIKLQLPTVENYIFFLSFPEFPFHFLSLLPVFLGHYLHELYAVESLIWVCFYGNTDQDNFSRHYRSYFQMILDYFGGFSTPFLLLLYAFVSICFFQGSLLGLLSTLFWKCLSKLLAQNFFLIVCF